MKYFYPDSSCFSDQLTTYVEDTFKEYNPVAHSTQLSIDAQFFPNESIDVSKLQPVLQSTQIPFQTCQLNTSDTFYDAYATIHGTQNHEQDTSRGTPTLHCYTRHCSAEYQDPGNNHGYHYHRNYEYSAFPTPDYHDPASNNHFDGVPIPTPHPYLCNTDSFYSPQPLPYQDERANYGMTNKRQVACEDSPIPGYISHYANHYYDSDSSGYGSDLSSQHLTPQPLTPTIQDYLSSSRDFTGSPIQMPGSPNQIPGTDTHWECDLSNLISTEDRVACKINWDDHLESELSYPENEPESKTAVCQEVMDILNILDSKKKQVTGTESPMKLSPPKSMKRKCASPYQNDEAKKRKVCKEPRRYKTPVISVLTSWFNNNLPSPYPTDADKVELMKKTGLGRSQIRQWFVNARRRYCREGRRPIKMTR